MAAQQSYEPKNLSINDKIDILNDLNAGLSPATISIKYLISIDQILWIEKNKSSIWELYRSEYYKMAEKMPISRGKFPCMENILYQWSLKQLTHVSNATFLDKARSILAITEEKQKRAGRPFIGTSSWVTAFKKRHNIKFTKRLTVAAKNSTSTVNNTLILNDLPEVIKTEQVTNNSINEGSFHSSSMIEVKIDEVDTHHSIIQSSRAEDTCVLNPQELPNPSGTLTVTLPKPQEPTKSPRKVLGSIQRRTRKNSITTPTWAVRIFAQTLKWAKENPTDEGDIRVLRKLHNRCLMSLNNAHKIKRESHNIFSK